MSTASPTAWTRLASPAPAPSTTTRPPSRRPSSPTPRRSTVCVGKDLTVTKTAAGTFNRTYLWSIDKNADKTLVKIAQGGSYTFTYTVDVKQTGVSDAGWTLAGKITISNPNDWQDVTLTSLVDAVDNGGTCTVDAGPYVVPKSGSLDVNYSCSYATAPSQLQRHQHRDRDVERDTGLHPGRHRLRQGRVHPGPAGQHQQDRPRQRRQGVERGLHRQRDGHRQRALGHRDVHLQADALGRRRHLHQVRQHGHDRRDRAVRLRDRRGLRRQGPDRHQDGGRHVQPDATSGRSTRTPTRPWSRSRRAAPTRSPTRSTSRRPASAMPAGRSPARSRSATPTTGRTSP